MTCHCTKRSHHEKIACRQQWGQTSEFGVNICLTRERRLRDTVFHFLLCSVSRHCIHKNSKMWAKNFKLGLRWWHGDIQTEAKLITTSGDAYTNLPIAELDLRSTFPRKCPVLSLVKDVCLTHKHVQTQGERYTPPVITETRKRQDDSGNCVYRYWNFHVLVEEFFFKLGLGSCMSAVEVARYFTLLFGWVQRRR
jgi:hypothetical protein